MKKLPLLHQQKCNEFYGLIPTARQHAIGWSQEPCHVWLKRVVCFWISHSLLNHYSGKCPEGSLNIFWKWHASVTGQWTSQVCLFSSSFLIKWINKSQCLCGIPSVHLAPFPWNGLNMRIEDHSVMGGSLQRRKVSQGPRMASAASLRCPCVIRVLSYAFSSPGECRVTFRLLSGRTRRAALHSSSPI